MPYNSAAALGGSSCSNHSNPDNCAVTGLDPTYGTAVGFSRLVIRRFDATGLTAPAAPGTARIDTATRTLDIRGTSGNDTITVRYHAGHVQSFSVKDFENIHVSGGDGDDDTIRVKTGLLNRGVLIRGDAGDDVLATDAYLATLDGGDGYDVAPVTRGSAAVRVRIEAAAKQ